MLDGHMLHEDHLGNRGDLLPGGAQWMTAGRGIIHSEMPQQESGRMRGFQLWINLPAAEKMKPASYCDIRPEEIGAADLPGGGGVRVIAGARRNRRRMPHRRAGPGSEYRTALTSTCACRPGGDFSMKIRPLHDRVIVKRLEEERKTASGIVIPDTAAEKPDQGEIKAVGPGKRDDNGKHIARWTSRSATASCSASMPARPSRSRARNCSSCAKKTSWAWSKPSNESSEEKRNAC
jgi:hypothetical protein